MKMQLCARCKKRPAMVFITRLENDKSINEGICLVCAKELGIKPITACEVYECDDHYFKNDTKENTQPTWT